jgi:hypothetical protein
MSRRPPNVRAVDCLLTDRSVRFLGETVAAYAEPAAPVGAFDRHDHRLNRSYLSCPKTCVFMGGNLDPETKNPAPK